MFTFIKNIFWVVSQKPGTYWLLGNITPGQALAAMALPFLAGAILAGLAVWYVARRRRAAAILDTLAAGYSSFNFWLKDGGALYVDGVKGCYISSSIEDTSTGGPAFELSLTTKQARAALDRAGYECLD